MLALLLSLALTTPSLAAGTEPAAATAVTYRYAGADGQQKELSVAEIVALVKADKGGQHFVWQPGWSGWKSWSDVPELKAAMEAADAPPAPPAPPTEAAADPVLRFADNGRQLDLKASEIAAKVKADPDGKYLAWRPGMAEWKPAAELPEVQAFLNPPAGTVVRPEPPPAPPPVGSEPTARTAKGKAEPTEAAPTEEPAKGVSPLLGGMGFRMGGELRTAFNMVNLGLSSDEFPDTGPRMEVLRARTTAWTRLGEHGEAVVAFDLSQNDDRSATAPTGWAARVPEGYVQLQSGGKVDVQGRVGAQTVRFGMNEVMDAYDGYYLGTREGSTDLAQRFGVIPYYDVGIGLTVEQADTWGVDVQYLNGTGVGSVDDNYGKAIVGRANLHVADNLFNAWVSGLYEQTQFDNSGIQIGFSGAAEVDLDFVKASGQILFGGEGTSGGEGYNSMGYQANLAGNIDLEKGVVDRIAPVLVFQGYNPKLGSTELLAGYALSTGVNVYWNAGADRVLLTGLGYEGYFPVDASIPLQHTLLIHTAAKF